MKFFILVIISFLLYTPHCIAQSPTPASITSIPPSPGVVLPQIMPTPQPTATPAQTEVVAEPAAPPAWVQDLLVKVESLPVVGPLAAKAALYAGILATILTGLVAFLFTVISALTGVFNVSGLTAASAWLTTFKTGKIMYWIQYLSMFNAKKPPSA